MLLGEGLTGLIGQVDLMGTGNAGGSTVEGGRPERECHHWLLRGGRRQEAVAGTNCVGDSKGRSIYVRAAK